MTDAADHVAIRALIENWALWRDARDWARFRTVWHDDGRMMATWFQGTADEFIKVSEEGYARGVRILHFLGGVTIEVAGTRAVAQTKMTISQRGRRRRSYGCFRHLDRRSVGRNSAAYCADWRYAAHYGLRPNAPYGDG